MAMMRKPKIFLSPTAAQQAEYLPGQQLSLTEKMGEDAKGQPGAMERGHTLGSCDNLATQSEHLGS